MQDTERDFSKFGVERKRLHRFEVVFGNGQLDVQTIGTGDLFNSHAVGNVWEG